MLQRDSIWDYVRDADTFDSFKMKVLKPIYLKPQFSKNIIGNVKTVEKLLLHSYFEYEFIDLALTHIVFTFEKALRIRSGEINSGLKPNATFEKLINWFLDNNYFETTNIDVFNQLRRIRNDKVHKTEKSLGGLAYISKVYHTTDLMNDLYEDKELRGKRKERVKSINQSLQEFVKGGVIFSANNKQLLVFNLQVLFIDNKSSREPIVHLAVSLIFDLKPYSEDRHPIPPCIFLQLKNFELVGEEIKATASDEIVHLNRINDVKNANKFDNWQSEFYSLSSFPMVLYLTMEPWEKYYVECLSKFHKAKSIVKI